MPTPTNDELLIRRLEWQNGLYLGLLTVMIAVNEVELNSSECQTINKAVEDRLRAGLPAHLRDIDANNEADRSATAGDGKPDQQS